MKTDSLLTLSSKLSYRELNSILNKSITTSLTDISSLSTQQITLKETCSCSTCTCSNSSMTYKKNNIQSHSFKNNDDCLAYAFIILYESSIWCMQIIYELFFKSLWQILMYVKQELQYDSSCNQTSSSCMDTISINKSTMENYSLISKNKNYSDLSRYHLPLFETRNHRRHCRLRRSNRKDKSMFWDKPRRSSSNQNMNQVSTEQKDSYSIDTHLIVVPIRSSHCQTEISKNDLQTINVDLNQSEKTINLHEQLTDTLCRRLHEPLMFMNRDMFCRHNRPSFCSTVSSDRNQKLSTMNTINLSSTTNGFLLSNTHNESSFLSNVTDVQSDKTLFSHNSQPFLFDLHQRKQSHKKLKENRQIINDHSIPLALASSLHSNLSLYNEDYFLTKYVHQLCTDKHYRR
ncbi:unnamed protein product [Rotaria sordida]|uniref:Uncharacterized protein n=3 Tax=Rotaria sordida TaxID=392033 RepID=A0A819H6F8_9BILA|nr:unnamed protein product [Rotaria sordida]